VSVQNPKRWLSNKFPHQSPKSNRNRISSHWDVLSKRDPYVSMEGLKPAANEHHRTRQCSAESQGVTATARLLAYITVTVEPYKPRTVPSLLTVSTILSYSCHLPASSCLWLLRWTALFVGECEARFKPNFVPTCAPCKIGQYTAKLRDCPFFQDLMEKESRLSRNKSSKIRQRTFPGHNEPENVSTARGPQKHTAHRPPPSSFTDYQQHLPAISVNNVWTRPLKFGNSQPHKDHRPTGSQQTFLLMFTLCPAKWGQHPNVIVRIPDLLILLVVTATIFLYTLPIAQQTILLCILRTILKCPLTETCPRLLKHNRKGIKLHNNQPAPQSPSTPS